MAFTWKSQIILKVYLDDTEENICEVPITPETTCGDVIDCCKEPGEGQCHLVEIWRGCERPVEEYERPYQILQQWGVHRDEVRFYLRHQPAVSIIYAGENRMRRNGMREDYQTFPGGMDMTLTELQDMAARQQQQIEAQQQMLVAKEQRLKYLKQQELRHQQAASENERLKQLREKVEAQELKLKKLRALRGQVEQFKTSNGTLSSELSAVRALFNGKEKELAQAVSKVEDLTKQLEELKQGKLSDTSSDVVSAAPALGELARLRKELTLRNKLNEQQSSKLVAHQDMLRQRKEEVTYMDKKIAELQARLRKKRAQQQQKEEERRKKPELDKAKQTSSANVATVPPYVQKDANQNGVQGLNKQDPKYQTLPHSIKFPSSQEKTNESNNNDNLKNNSNNQDLKPNGHSQNQPVKTVTETFESGEPHKPPGNSKLGTKVVQKSSSLQKPVSASATTAASQPPAVAAKPKFSMSNFAPRPYGSTFGTSKSLTSVSAVTTAPQTPSAADNSTFAHPPMQPITSTPISHPGDANTGSKRPLTVLPPAPASLTKPPPPYPSSNTANSNKKPSPQQLSPPQSSVSASASSSDKKDQMSPPIYLVASSHPQAPPQPQTATAVAGSSSSHSAAAHAAVNDRVPSSQSSGVHQSHTLDSQVKESHYQPPPQSTYQGAAAAPRSQAESRSSRYAPRSVIANTYTNRLGPAALEKYRQNMSQIYKDYLPGHIGGQRGESDPRHDDNRPMSPTNYRDDTPGSPRRHPMSPTPPSQPAYYAGEPDIVDGGRPMSPQQRGYPPPSYPGSPPYSDPERLHYHPNAPRPLRHRRPSLGEADEAAKLRGMYAKSTSRDQEPYHRHTEQQPTQQQRGAGPPPDVISAGSHSQHPSSLSSMGQGSSAPQPSTQQDYKHPNVTKDSHVQDVILRQKKSNVKNRDTPKGTRRVSFDPLALLLDASLEGELDLVMRTAREVRDPSEPNDEGITALHNSICAGHFEIVKFLVEIGCNVNAPDSDGWTPLHCAASCNNLAMVRLLVENGACIYATTISDQETAAEKCEEDEDGFDGCSQYLYGIQEKLGLVNKGEVFALFDFQAEKTDELSFKTGDKFHVLRKGDDTETEWWWCRHGDREGYVPRNLLGVYPRKRPEPRQSQDDIK